MSYSREEVDRIVVPLEAHIKDLESRLSSALAELRQCYQDDGCTKQEIEDQLSRFVVETPAPKSGDPWEWERES